ncbi:MAG TPA: hypothetical protein VKU39_19760 [Streptosporangiaceae bacterium]|nr:hypothetical protein [Streptosporangiaceae bacterium]
MFLIRAGRPAEVTASLGARARDAAAAAIPQAKRAGSTAIQWSAQGVETARGWAAPRLDQAADAFTGAVAPKVSSALHSTASKVAPAPAGKTGIRRLLDWRLLLGVGAVIAAAGAAAAMTMRKRYQDATLAAREDAEMDSDSDEMAPARDETTAWSDANGHVSSARH